MTWTGFKLYPAVDKRRRDSFHIRQSQTQFWEAVHGFEGCLDEINQKWTAVVSVHAGLREAMYLGDLDS